MINLWFKNIFGKIPSTDKLEEQRRILEIEWDKFQKIKSSELIARYQYLDEIIHSEDFLQRKNNIEHTVYKNSTEEKLTIEFDTLSKDKNLKLFFKTKDSEALKRYKTIADSDVLAKFNTVKEVVDSGEVENAKSKLKLEHEKLISKQKRFHSLKKNSELKRYFKIINSDKYQTYLSVKDGELIEKYFELKKFVENFDFKQINKTNKGEFEQELNKLSEYKTLKRDSNIKVFLKVESAKMPDFVAGIEKSDLLSEYSELEELVKSDEFAKELESTKFENSELYKLFLEYKSLSKNSDIVFYHKFENSSSYKNYLQILDSDVYQRYNELYDKLNSEEFIKIVEYLKDNSKYKKTEDYKLIEEFEELSKNSDVVWFNGIDEDKKFAKLRANKVVFFDDFEQSSLNENNWSTVLFPGMVSIKKNYSTQSEKQCYLNGNNINLQNSLATIITKNENAKGKMWSKKMGFTDHDFKYTSGTFNTAQYFRFNKGRVEAKLKVSKGDVVHGFSLKYDNNLPHIDVFRSNGKFVDLRYLSDNNVMFAERVKGLNVADKFYIYALEWNENELIWSINDVEICRAKHSLNSEKLYINIASILEKDSVALPNYFQIDWVRVSQLVD